jgi:hypothetical protein
MWWSKAKVKSSETAICGVRCKHCGGSIVMAKAQFADEISLPCRNCGRRAFYSRAAIVALPAIETSKQAQSPRMQFGSRKGQGASK